MMKKVVFLLSTVFILLSSISMSYGQCKTYARSVCMGQLSPYYHDGIFNAAELGEGETAEIFKTFYSDQTYKVVICAAKPLKNVIFEVYDVDRNLLYSNVDDDYSTTWEFTLEESQQLILSVHVVDDNKGELDWACLAVMIGFQNKY